MQNLMENRTFSISVASHSALPQDELRTSQTANEPPYLMPELWDLIFEKTNIWTCLENSRLEAAKKLLQGRIAKNAALREAVVAGRLDHLKLLVCKLHLSSKDVKHTRALSSLSEYKQTSTYPGQPNHMGYLSRVPERNELTLVELAIKHGRVKILKWLIENHFDDACSEKIVEHLLEHGPLAAVQIIYATKQCWIDNFGKDDQEFGWRRTAMCNAASGHQLGILKFLLRQPEFVSRDNEDFSAVAGAAAGAGRIEAIKCIFKHRPECDFTNVPASAIQTNRQKTLKWLCQNHRSLFTWNPLKDLMWHDWISVETLKCLNKFSLLPEYFAQRISGVVCVDPAVFGWIRCHYPDMQVSFRPSLYYFSGSLKRVKSLYESRALLEQPNFWVDDVTECTKLPVIRWLVLNNHANIVGPHAMDYAQDLETIKFLHSTGTTCTHKALDNAAERGCLESVKFLHEEMSQVGSDEAMHLAATNGHLNVVKYLHENGHGCTRETIGNAVWKEHHEIAAFLWNNRNEGCNPLAKVITDSGIEMPLTKWLQTGAKETLESLKLPKIGAKKKKEGIKCFFQGFRLQVDLRSRKFPFYDDSETEHSLFLE